MDDDGNILDVVSRIEGISDADRAWFFRLALRAIQMTAPNAVHDDIVVPGGRYSATVALWATQIFENGSWNSTIALPAQEEPRSDALSGCHRVGTFKQDLPIIAKSRHDWALALERGNAEQVEENQRDPLRRRGADAYLRARVDRIDDSVFFEYVDRKLRWAPAQFVAFPGDHTSPTIEARGRAMAVQDMYQAKMTVRWNGRLLVHLFRKQLFNNSTVDGHVPRQGEKIFTAHDFHRTPKVVIDMRSLMLL